MADPVVAFGRNRNARLAQLLTVGFALVAQRVKLSGKYERGWEPGEALRARRTCVWVGAVLVRQVMAPEPFHVGAREYVAVLREFAMRRSFVGGIDRGINQQLVREFWPTTIARHQGNCSREISTGAVATDGDSIRVYVERARVVGHPFGCRVTILWSGWELMLGRETVIDGHGDAWGALREIAAGHVVRLDIADHPSTAMKVHKCPEGAAPRGRVDSHLDIAGGTRDFAIFGLRNFFRLTAKRLKHGIDSSPRLGRRHRMERLGARRRGLVEDSLHLGIELHSRLLRQD